MRNRLLWFLLGMVAASLLSMSMDVVSAQNPALMGGSFSGTIKAVQVDTNGYIIVQGH